MENDGSSSPPPDESPAADESLTDDERAHQQRLDAARARADGHDYVADPQDNAHCLRCGAARGNACHDPAGSNTTTDDPNAKERPA